MRILFHIHGFPPDHNAGAEWMAKDIASWLQRRGHSIQVAVRDSSVGYFDGLTITQFDNSYDLVQWYDWAEVVITHLDETGRSINISQHKGKPLVHLIHNTNRIAQLTTKKPNMYVAYNSQHTKQANNYGRPSVVVRPPTFEADHKVKSGDNITLIGLSESKGGDLLQDIAAELPNEDFIGVKGDYGKQITDQPENVEVVENTPDIKSVYRRTKILLVPSKSESWGRVAVEAMCSGIPVIATPTDGLKESCGDAALFVDRDGDWAGAIRYMLSDWQRWSRKARERFEALDFEGDLINFEQFLEDIYDYKSKKNTKT